MSSRDMLAVTSMPQATLHEVSSGHVARGAVPAILFDLCYGSWELQSDCRGLWYVLYLFH